MNVVLYISDLIKKANNILVLTGAGVSTSSGIPDFRSKTGIYNQNPERILSRDFFFTFPGNFYDFLEKNLIYKDAKPNEAHKILAKWEQEGKVFQIVTQNIDGLHQEAGSRNVIEFHGTVKTATCYNPKCQKQYTIEEVFEREKIKEDFWECDCGVSSTRRYIKPDFVLFGDSGSKWLTGNNFHDICCMAYDADLVLAIGTSFQVYPFKNIPKYRNKDTKTPLVIINKGKTDLDNEPNVFKVEGDIIETLKDIEQFIIK